MFYGLKFDQTSLEKINCFKVKFVRTYLYFPYVRAQDFLESRWDGRVVRWCRVKLPVPGRPTDLDDSWALAYYACSGCGWG